MRNIPKELKKLILYHYRRSGPDPDLREFRVILEWNNIKAQVGEYVAMEGTGHTPKEVYTLIEQGWRVKIIQSCFRWSWEAYRYVDEWSYKMSQLDYDCYGRPRIRTGYDGWYEKVVVFDENGKEQHYSKKWWLCALTQEETIDHDTIPKEIEALFDSVPWLEGNLISTRLHS